MVTIGFISRVFFTFPGFFLAGMGVGGVLVIIGGVIGIMGTNNVPALKTRSSPIIKAISMPPEIPKIKKI